MTKRCADLDEFFDGELAADQADAFRDHLATCERCDRVLDGRMQELTAARGLVRHTQRVPDVASSTAAAPTRAAPIGEAPAVASRAPASHKQARPWGCARTLAYVAPVLAAAAAVPLWLRSGDPEFQLSVPFDRAEQARRGETVHVGDVLRPTVSGERYRAIWVYLGDRKLLATCPGDDRCRDAGDELTLSLPLTAHGMYHIVGLGSRDVIPAPQATLDETLTATRRAGIRTLVQHITVD
jgi:hypothetical protein